MKDYEVDLSYYLGSGSYGAVFKGRKKITGSPVAVKISKSKNGVSRSTVREICLLKMLSDDPHFVKVLHAEEDKNEQETNIVMEYVDTDLERYYRKSVGDMPIKDLMFQLCKGLALSHSRGIMHRDLKPSNLLLDKNKKLKIADMGLGRKINIPTQKYTPLVGSPWYTAPEILMKTSTYTVVVDMWSAGCIFAELARREPLFATSTGKREDQLKKIFSFLGTPNESLWPGVPSEEDMSRYTPQQKKSFKSMFPQLDKKGRNLLKRMLCYDPAQRISAKDAMDHPYFDGLEKDNL